MKWNDYDFPVFDGNDLMQLRFAQAKVIAADALARNFPSPCTCTECVKARNLPAVQRILAKWAPMDGTK